MRYDLANTVNKLEKRLRPIEGRAGVRAYKIVDDFIALTEASLRMLPTHARAIIETGQPAVDPPDVAELWERLRATYPRECFNFFNAAYHSLIDAAHFAAQDGRYIDYLGELYMQYGYASPGAGQYFTPHPVCRMMAEVLAGSYESECQHRLMTAFEAARPALDEIERALLDASVIAGLVAGGSKYEHFITRIMPLIGPYVEPLRVYDPAIGSGRLLLAYAEQIPRWAIDAGLIAFYGQDIDETCVLMAKANTMLYGLNREIMTADRVQEAAQFVGLIDSRMKINRDARIRARIIGRAINQNGGAKHGRKERVKIPAVG